VLDLFLWRVGIMAAKHIVDSHYHIHTDDFFFKYMHADNEEACTVQMDSCYFRNFELRRSLAIRPLFLD